MTISINQFAINQSIKNDNNNNVWLWNWNAPTCTGTDQIGWLLSEIFHLHIITVLWPWLSYTLLLFLLSLKFTQAKKNKQPVYNNIVKNKKCILAKKQSFFLEGYQNHLVNLFKGSFSQLRASCKLKQLPVQYSATSFLFFPYHTHNHFPTFASTIIKKFPKDHLYKKLLFYCPHHSCSS